MGWVKPGALDLTKMGTLMKMVPPGLNLSILTTLWSLQMINARQFDAAAFARQRDVILQTAHDFMEYTALDYLGDVDWDNAVEVRHWYARIKSRPAFRTLLNDRVARLIGQVVTVVEPIASGQGRVKVGDGEWLASGPDAPAGAKVRIIGGRGGSLDVELA